MKREPNHAPRVTPRRKCSYGQRETLEKNCPSEPSDELTSVLANDPTASVPLTLEISADFPNEFSDQIKRAVSENAKSPGVKVSE